MVLDAVHGITPEAKPRDLAAMRPTEIVRRDLVRNVPPISS
jgi:hypothetical protein